MANTTNVYANLPLTSDIRHVQFSKAPAFVASWISATTVAAVSRRGDHQNGELLSDIHQLIVDVYHEFNFRLGYPLSKSF